MSGVKPAPPPSVSAVLGPTNTGKTHLAMERMLAQRSGMIGFPLRLLARENYDRAVAIKGADKVALVTGEEKIVPPDARYYLCTVEAMPMDIPVEFLAIDEIQVAADPDRGHVFTDRLLYARGRNETLFLGAESMRPVIRKLVPDASFATRPRLSKLSYAGVQKINRLKPRSAVVAFTANDVYALAEVLRRQKGGAAVVLGALSPRTRNAQVALYQAGEVDYLVATDAIGMGLNMDVRHVAFASTRKFDGKRFRVLQAAELAQIAGRAGRHANDGTFAVTPEAGDLTPETLERIEDHRFDSLRQVYWRNDELDFSGIDPLLASLRERSGRRELTRVREADDEISLADLGKDREIAALAQRGEALELLWEICQIPDFEKQWSSSHVRFLDQVFRHLTARDAKLPADWVAEHIERIDRTDGGIDTLSARIARVRTWTYISHKAAWLDNAIHWQERAREIEDKLSDALHDSLTQRFVDKRTTALIGGLRERRDVVAAIRKNGEVLVEGQFVGRLDGLQFHADETRFKQDRRAIMGAVMPVLSREIKSRIWQLGNAPDGLAWRTDNAVLWRGEPVARLDRGRDVYSPRVVVLANPLVEGANRERLSSIVQGLVSARISALLGPLTALPDKDATAAVRGILFRLSEGLGALARTDADEQIAALSRDDRKALSSAGVRIGREAIFFPALLKPGPIGIRARLWTLWRQPGAPYAPPDPGAVSVDATPSPDHRAFLSAIGYRTFDGGDAPFALRLDMVERVANACWSRSREGAFPITPELISLTNRGEAGTAAVVRALGFRASDVDGKDLYARARPPKRRRNAAGHRRARQPKTDADSPFAVLAGRFGGP